ncbi:hypothetical protein Pla100_58060 [Neorhodopirellula pilleata]|uniref:Uncharacterized protein n=1 Tax=Neorhodopirellula pilleata TaxID=2714738 RepID=A0A5C5ZKL3_9BACT|nr:hypothetical protein Pla100_58060 [Neorhodopirellula pilleata]
MKSTELLRVQLRVRALLSTSGEIFPLNLISRSGASGLLILSFNGKPQATELENADACGLPLNENAQSCTKSTAR